MSQLTILLPFGLPPPELANDLLRECKAPALATLLSRAKSHQSETFDIFARTLPHERWLAQRLPLHAQACGPDSPAFAAAAMAEFGLAAQAGVWFIVEPVHIHVARDHLVLTDRRRLSLTEREADSLFESAAASFAEAGLALQRGDGRVWFVRADEWSALQTASPDAACGRNIDIWMPKGPGELAWRKLQNEVQMAWHTDAVNQEREANGLPSVNSIWLWGGAALTGNAIAPADSGVAGWPSALGIASAAFAIPDVAASRAEFIALDGLCAPALAGDWSGWLHAMEDLDSNFFAPVLDGLKSKRLDRVTLVASRNGALAEYGITPGSLKKFWVKPSLSRLAS